MNALDQEKSSHAEGGEWPVLADSPRLRLATFGALYVAQGLPEGLLYVSVPAWLAAQGVGASAIGGFIGVILLPWSLKLINGALMDRWTFLAMGRRRPWVLAAQTGLVVSLIVLGMLDDPTDMAALMFVGVIINTCGAFQDVAVDGMAIDVLPPKEQASANGVMWGSKVLGIAGSAAVTGWLLSSYGLRAAALTTAIAVAAIMVAAIVFRERSGERFLPWSAGAASTRARAYHIGNWAAIVRSLFRAALTRRSVGFAAATFVALASYGLFMAAMPVITVQSLKWADTDFTELAGSAGLIGGIFGIVAGGFLTDRFGAKRTLLATLMIMAVIHGGIALSQSFWDVRAVMIAYVVAYKILFVLMSVSIYAIAMRISVHEIAATQFALFMAFVNLGTSGGAALLGPVHVYGGDAGVFAALVAIAAVAVGGYSIIDLNPPGSAD
ncbi:MAG: MFS transporter [Rhodobacteraceae bacterium]|nr:MFS transporter [Paracoccaceae bacterium]